MADTAQPPLTTYQVRSPVDHDHIRYALGSEIALSDAVAAPLLALGAIERTTAATNVEVEMDDVDDAIVATIGRLDPDDPNHFTRSGAPQVGALETLLDRNITSAERDAAWATYQARRGE